MMKPSSQADEDKKDAPLPTTGSNNEEDNQGILGGSDEESKASSDDPAEEQRNATMNAVEDHFLCPITQEVMRDPVMDSEGNTWERGAILQWIRSHNRTSPKTGNLLREKQLVPNRILRNLIASIMGSEHVQESSGGDTLFSCSNDVSYRGRVNGFLAFIGELSGQTLQLNVNGLCALQYQDLIVVVDVPSDSESFFMYTVLVKELDPSAEAEILKKAMLLNHLLIETKGASLGLDPVTGEIVFCVRERVEETDPLIFRNILENFIDKALDIRTKLRHGVANPDPANET